MMYISLRMYIQSMLISFSESILFLKIVCFAGNYGITVEESCLNEVGGEYCASSACEGKVELANILEQDAGEDNIFFIETSPKEVITPREACSLESAARNSGLHVVMVRAGKVLDKSDNTTCQLLNR